jgi:hypothetical protein
MAKPASKGILAITGETLSLTKAGSYTFEYLPSGLVKIKLDGQQATVLKADEYAAIKTFTFAPGAVIDSQVRISGVTFREAGPAGGFEPNHKMDDLIGRLIEEHGVAWTARNLIVNGSQADTFKVLWDYLDDAYVAGQNYYNLPLNETFVRLGVEYARYLDAGGRPLTNVTAKFTADNGDADTIPQREQSMHDNLLGNLAKVSIQDRNFGAELEAELLALVPDAYESRAVYSGDQGARGGAAHDAVRAFDYDRGWDRPDYLDRSYDALIDPLARNPASPNNMYYGTSNPADDWNVVRHEGAQVELGLKIKHRGGDEYAEASIGPDGVATYNVLTGPQATNPNRAEWNFDFAATDFSPDDDFVYTLELDVDPTAGVKWVTLYSSANPLDTNLGTGATFQNSTNIAFYKDFIDIDPATPGIQPYALGEGRFAVRLSAFDKADGSFVAANQVEVVVGGGSTVSSAAGASFADMNGLGFMDTYLL